MKNTAKKSWRDISINDYFQLRDNLEQFENEYEKEVYLISFINGVSEDEVYNYTVSQLQPLKDSLKFLNEFEISPDIKFKKIFINNSKYTIDTDLQKFTVAQYIDFQTFFPKRTSKQNYIGNLLACFIIPKGHKYNEGYDIAELINDINNNVDILTANEIIFFFLKQYLTSIKVLQLYFNYQMKILKKIAPKKSKATVERLQAQWEEMQKNISAGFNLLTTSQS